MNRDGVMVRHYEAGASLIVLTEWIDPSSFAILWSSCSVLGPSLILFLKLKGKYREKFFLCFLHVSVGMCV